MQSHRLASLVSTALLAVLTVGTTAVQAEIVATPSGNPGATGTIVSPDLTITGGTTSGTNLFHSFSQFGLTPQQTATFQTNPAIQNVLARINGGDPSVIDGMIKLTGSNASLYLMNPAGIILGQNSRINVPASFVATTASNIAIGNNLFNAIGINDYSSLVGQPSGFVFQPGATGAIVNVSNQSGLYSFLEQSRGQEQVDQKERTIALIGHTIFNLDALYFSKNTNIVTIAAPENSVVGSFSQSNSIDLNNLNQFYKPANGSNVYGLSVFNAFPIPKFSDLVPLFSNVISVRGASPGIPSRRESITVENDSVTYNDTREKFSIREGDLFFGSLGDFGFKKSTGTITVLGDRNIKGYGVSTDKHVLLKGDSVYLAGGISGSDVEIFANNTVDMGGIFSTGGSIRVQATGDVNIGVLDARLPLGAARSDLGGNINVKARTFRATGILDSSQGFASTPSQYSTGQFSVLATGSISIEQTGGGRFVEAGGFEKGANGSVVYRRATNRDREVTIAGVDLYDSDRFSFDYDFGPIPNPFLKDKVTGELIPYNGPRFVLKDVKTGEVIRNDYVFMRRSEIAESLDNGGTMGLIGRRDKLTGLVVELTQDKLLTPNSLDTQIDIKSPAGGLSLANAVGGTLPGAYSNNPGVNNLTTTPFYLPAVQPVAPITPVPSPIVAAPEPLILPSPPTIAESPTTLSPTPKDLNRSSEIILYHRPVLSNQTTTIDLNDGLLKVQFDPREQGILTLYRQPTEKEPIETTKP